MKRLFALFASILIILAGIAYRSPIQAFAYSLLYRSQCDTPKTFRIGSIDSKYNISHDQFKENISRAGNLWGSEYGKTLFMYDPEGEIEVNLVYDQRQFLSTQINDLNSRVKSQQNELDPRITDYKNKASAFRAKAAQLNSDIEFWNNKGGAPPEEYEKLKSRQESLKNEAAALQQEAASLNQSAEEYNEQVGQLQQTVSNFNEQLSYKPEEGEYIYDNGKQTINIYFDNSETQLIHTLAHELGHALEIPHNNNPLSIMYPQSTAVISLSSDDKNALLKACEKISLATEFSTKIKLIISNFHTISPK